MSCIHIYRWHSPFGEIHIASFKDALCMCDWEMSRNRPLNRNRISRYLNAVFKEDSSDIITETISQLSEYFESKRTEFDLPLIFCGTDFQKAVWSELLNIPYGKTISYGQQASYIGNPKAVRAVAAANSMNAISIIVPCHRVIGANGDISGYAGGVDIKRQLLSLESSGFCGIRKKL